MSASIERHRGRVLDEADPGHECKEPESIWSDGMVVPISMRNGAIWQCDCGRVYRHKRDEWGYSNRELKGRKRARALASVAAPPNPESETP